MTDSSPSFDKPPPPITRRPELAHRFAQRLTAARWGLLILALVLAGLAWQPATDVEYDRSIENMFADSDPVLKPYRRFKQVFGGSEIVLAVYEDAELLTREGIARQHALTEALAEVPGVKDVLSLSSVNATFEAAMGGESSGASGRGPPPIVDPDHVLGRRYREMFLGYTHNPVGDTAAIICLLEPESETEVPRSLTIAGLRQVMQAVPEPAGRGMVAGEPVMVVDGFEYVEADGRRLTSVSLILLSLTIMICFRSLRWVLIPIAVVQLTLLLTRAVLALVGLQLSMVSSMMNAMVAVIGVATVVHIIVRFREARRVQGPRESLVTAGALLTAPIFWACSTDGIGFLALTLASVGPVQDYGIMMGIASAMVLVAVALVVPPLALIGSFDQDPHRAWGEGSLVAGLRLSIEAVQRWPRVLACVLSALLLVSAWGLTRLAVETDFTRNFRSGSAIIESYEFVEQRLGGAGIWDVMIPAPATLTPQYLQQVHEYQQRLRELRIGEGEQSRASLTKVLSFVDADRAAQGDPILRLAPPEVRARAMAQVMPSFMEMLRTTEPDEDGRYYLRVMLRSQERQPADEKLRIIEQVREVTRESFPEGEAEVTGFFVLLTYLVQSIIRDQWTCFIAATLGIGGMMWVAFRSLKMTLIALVPNAFPILVLLGAMGWAGVKINMGAAMIAAVSMGLSIDSSIHYITAYRRIRATGVGVLESLLSVQQMVGRAASFSTLALVVGFSVLILSQFVPTIYFGVLASLAMLGGLLGNLIILPLLLLLFDREPSQPSGQEQMETAGPRR